MRLTAHLARLFVSARHTNHSVWASLAQAFRHAFRRKP